MDIQPQQVQIARMGNHFLLARCNSAESVVVTWASSGFVQTVSAKTWNEGAFLSTPERFRVLAGQEAQAAMPLFVREQRRRPTPAKGWVEGLMSQAG